MDKDSVLQALWNNKNGLNAIKILEEMLLNEQEKLLYQLNGSQIQSPEFAQPESQRIGKRGRSANGSAAQQKRREDYKRLGAQNWKEYHRLKAQEESGDGQDAPLKPYKPTGIQKGQKLSPRHKRAVVAALHKRLAEYKAWGCKNWADYRRIKEEKAQ